jgi:large subunit ribosomal protein L15
MLRLHNLKPRPGARHRVKRLGCGESSGHGKTSGKGHKGQKARSGGSIRLGFEGGQMPLIRRLPKRGFNNAAFRRQYAVVNLNDLNVFKSGTVVTEQLLREWKLVRGNFDGIKILGDGELKHRLTIEADAVSAGAREKIERAGGAITLREEGASSSRESDAAATVSEAAEADARGESPARSEKKKGVAAKASAKSAPRAKRKTRVKR